MVIAVSFITDCAKPGTAYSMCRQARIVAGESSVCGFDPPARNEALGHGPRNGVCTETPTFKNRELAGRVAETHSPLRNRAPNILIRGNVK